MTDGDCVPAGAFRSRRQLGERSLLDATVTCGHAFGGDYEAVSVYSALAVARHIIHADATIVAMGPGIVGTATPARVQRHRGGAGARRRASGLRRPIAYCAPRSPIRANATGGSPITAQPR